MSASICIILDSCPSLDEISQHLRGLGLSHKHSLPADEHWPYPMHVFGCADLRLTYYAGDPLHGEAMIESRTVVASSTAEVRLHLVSAAITRRFGGLLDEADLDYAEFSA